MKVQYRSSFLKDLSRLNDQKTHHRVNKLIEHIKEVDSIQEVPKAKRMSGNKNMYRIRLGQFRVGVYLKGKQITFVRCLHRKDIYRYFP